MAVDFIKSPRGDEQKKIKVDFYKPPAVDAIDQEKEYLAMKERFESEKAAFELEKVQALKEEVKEEPKKKYFIRKRKGELNESV